MPWCSQVERRIGWNPQHKPAHRVLVQAGSVGVACGDQLTGIVHIGGEEEVERRAVLNLLGEGSGGSERKLHLHAGLLFVAVSDFFQRCT